MQEKKRNEDEEIRPDQEWEERQELSEERIREISTESDDGSARRDFWHELAEMILGNREADGKWLSRSGCPECFGESAGKYYFFLYGLEALVPYYRRENEQALLCSSEELFIEMYLIAGQGDKSELRDTLYWFCSDYAELYVSFFIKKLSEGKKLRPGGPLLVLPEEENFGSGWEDHFFDCALYMGKRYEERLFQAVCGQMAENASAAGQFVFLVEELLKDREKTVFCLNGVQKEEIKRFLWRVREAFRTGSDGDAVL